MGLEEELKTNFRSEAQKLRLNIHYTSHYLLSRFQTVVMARGLTLSQFNVLRILRGQHPQKVSLNSVGERMIDKHPDVSRIIDRLVKKGYVSRMEASCDRRQKEVTITPNGLKLLEQLDDCERGMDSLINHLSSSDVCFLNEILDSIRTK